MVRRRHGWQLPAHPFQVVAITVFFLLAVAFYVFLAPFLWFQVLEITALALYSPLALAVFLLYVRCSAIDPADRGVFQPQSKDAEKGPYSEGTTHGDALHPFSPGLSTPSRSPSVMPPDKKRESKAPYVEQSAVGWSLNQIQMLPAAFCGLFCGWLVKPDHCRDDSNLQQPLAEEEVLFCTLCNAEVRKLSKHCRSCDKCVDGFDHHCRWLNNCVGRKNYSTFVSLMATSLSLLVLEWGIGMAVFVRCFADRRGIEHQIVDKLGNGFSRGPFATVVAIFTLVALLASVPLGELFFFHLILIRKGITTYEYVVAMRVQNEQQGLAEGDVSGFPTSPSSSSVTALSNSSSVGLQYSRGGWCTPPRIFVDQQDEVLGAGRLPSTVDPDAGNMASRYNTQHRKGVVRISAWKLAKLNTDEARRAGAKAREASSILRQLEPRGPLAGDSEYTSSNNISRSSSVSGDYSSRKQRLRDNSTDASLNAQDLPTYTVEDYSSIQRERLEVGNQSRSSGGSPSHTVNVPTLSPLPGEGRYGLSFPNTGLHSRATLPADSMAAIPREVAGDSQVRADVPAHHVTVMSLSSAEFSRIGSGPPVSSDGYEASSGESADDIAFPSRSHFASRDRVFTDHVALPIEEERKMSLIGDRPSGGNVLPEENRATTNPLYNTPGYRYQWVDPSASASSLSNDRPSSDYVPERFFPSQRSMMAEASPSLHGSSLGLDNLVYSGTSIFYGGPMEYPLDKP